MKNKKVRTMGICLSVAMVTNAANPMAVMAQTPEKSTPSVTIKVDHSRSVSLKAEVPTVATSKVYDGTVNAEILSLGEISGIRNGDDVSVEATAEYENKDAGSDKTIIVTYTLSGKDADKYTAPDSISIPECEILPKPLQVVHAKATDRTYDETVSVQPDQTSLGALQETDLVEGDDVKLDTSSVVMTVADPNAGENKSVTVEGYALIGEDIENYELLSPDDVTVTIHPIQYDAEVLEQIKWNQTEFEYNGSEQKPEILEDTLPSGVIVDGYTYSEDCVNPGMDKTVNATLSCDNPNVTLAQSSISSQWSIIPCQPTVVIDYLNETVTVSYPENYEDIPSVQAGISYTAEKETRNEGTRSVLQLTEGDLPSEDSGKNVEVTGVLVNEQQETFYSDTISIPSRPTLDQEAIKTAAAQISGSWTATTNSLTCDSWTSSDLELRLVFADGSTTSWKDDASFSDLTPGTHIESVQFRSKAIEDQQFASTLQTQAVDLYVLQESRISVNSEFGKVYDGEPASVESDFYTYNGDGEVLVTWYDLDGNILEEVPSEVGTYRVVLSVPQTAQYTATSTEPMSYTISKMQAPEIIWPTASEITYGQSLSKSSLTSQDSAGSFTWKDASVIPSVSDSNKTAYTVVYTPNDTEHYDYSNVNLERGITIFVQKAKAAIDVSGIALSYTYSGEAQPVNFGAVLNHREVGLSYSIDSVTEPGTYTLTISAPETDNYLAASAEVEISVTKADAPEILWPTAGEITYGQSLADSTLSSEDAYGSFAWLDASVAPSVSDSDATEYVVVYTPNDTEHYDYSDVALEHSVTVSVKKAKAAIDVSAIDLSYIYNGEAQTVNSGAVLNHSEADLSYSIDSVTEPGTYTLTVSAPETDNYFAASAEVEITVAKTPAPEILWPIASEITYGQSLADSALSSEDTYGSFVWLDASIIPAVADSDTTPYDVVYTPNDTDYYDYSDVALERGITVPVKKAKAAIDVSGIALSYTYNGEAQSVNSGAVLNHSEAELSYSIDSVTEPGTYTLTVSAPETDNYLAASAEVEITVAKTPAPEILWPIASEITYGQSLADSALSSEDTYGSFVWLDASIIPAVADSDTTEYNVVYSPNDTDYYDYSDVALERGITVPVKKAKAAIDVSGIALSYTYNGEAQPVNSGAVLNHSEAELSYSIDSVTEPGTYTLTVSAPETDNYLAASTEVEITVAKAQAPEILWPTASAITYGQSLADSALSSEDTYGSFAWLDASIAPSVSDSDATEYVVVYTPNDTEHYDYSDVALERGITVPIKKAKAAIDVSGIALSYTYNGEAQFVNSGAVLSHSEADLSYSIDSVTEPGTYTLTVSAPETDNYLAASAEVEISVAKAQAPEILWPTASAITYGQSLADSALSSEDTYGSFAWLDASIAPSVSDSDATEYVVLYTPNDTEHYDYSDVALEHSITLSVQKAKAAIDVSGIALSYTYNGEAQFVNSGAVLSHSEADLSYSIDSVTEPGTYTLTVSAPETDNYLAASAEVEITVAKAQAPEILWPTASAITYGQSLADSALSSEDTYGSFAWLDASIAPSVSDSDATEYVVVYTPNDTEHYDYSDVALEHSITLSVQKAKAAIDVSGMTLSYTYNGEAQPVNSGAVLNHSESELYYSMDSVTDAGTYTVSIYSQETDNYLAAAVEVEITVEKAAAPEIVWPTAEGITYGQSLSESTLTGGITEYGTFAWAEDVERPSAGTVSYEVIFTPTDTANYNWTQSEYRSEVSVNVAKKSASLIVSNAEKTYSDSDPELSATAEGLLEGDTLTYQLSRTPGESAGTYEILATIDEHSNYEITAVNGTLTINPKQLIALNMTTSCVVGFDQETQKQTVAITLSDGSVTLSEGIDYTVNYQEASEETSACITVTGMGNYTGEQKYDGFILNRSDELCSFDAAVLFDEETNQNVLSIQTSSNRTETGEEMLDAYGDPIYSQRNLSLSREFLDALAAQSITQINFQVKEATLLIPLQSMTGSSYLVRLAPMDYEDMTWREYMLLDEYLELSSSYRFRITTPMSAEEIAKLTEESISAQEESSEDGSQPSEEALAEIPTEKDVTSQIEGLSARIAKPEKDKIAQSEGTELAERKVLLVLRESESYDAARVELQITEAEESYKTQLPASGMICLVEDRPENQ